MSRRKGSGAVPRVPFALALASCLLAACSEQDPGILSLKNPDELYAGSPGEMRLAYQTGAQGMQAGDSLWLELPAAWYSRHGCPNVDDVAVYQSLDPEEPNYFGVEQSGPGLRFVGFTFPFRRLDGLGSRFKSILVLSLQEGRLRPEEAVTILIRGWEESGTPLVPEAGGSGWIRALWVPRLFAGEPVPLDPLRILVQSGPAHELVLVVPSLAQVGEPITLSMRLLDRHYNPCSMWPSSVRLDLPEGVEGIPAFLPEKALNAFPEGWVRLGFRVREPGDFRVRAFLDGLGKSGESNPLRIVEAPPAARIFWGDLHVHSEVSKDGMGEMPFRYAREVSQLDFCAVTEHHTLEDLFYPVKVLLPASQWEALQDEVRSRCVPGEFVTLLGFENSAQAPSGHHNVYYPDEEGPLPLVNQLNETWEAVEPHEALIIQHHPGIFWIIPGVPAELLRILSLLGGDWVDWAAWPGIPRPALEIYSLHGQSEYWKPEDPLSYEWCDLTLPREGESKSCQTGVSAPGPHYARDAWASGLRLGAVAGSDDHRAQPGKPGGGLTAVWTDGLTRESIFEAIRARRTYATTGDRILLDFRINGAVMGSEIEADGPPSIWVEVLGTDSIHTLEVLRYRLGRGPWEPLARIQPESASTHLALQDTSFSGDTLYFVRLEQSNLTHGRPVRAWSSPIWVRDRSGAGDP